MEGGTGVALSGAYFDVMLIGTGAVLSGGFLSVSGLDMEVDYEVYTEGGSNYPRFFFKNTKPQTLVLEQGVVTTVDSVSLLMAMVNQGCPFLWRGPSFYGTASAKHSGSGPWWERTCRSMWAPS